LFRIVDAVLQSAESKLIERRRFPGRHEVKVLLILLYDVVEIFLHVSIVLAQRLNVSCTIGGIDFDFLSAWQSSLDDRRATIQAFERELLFV